MPTLSQFYQVDNIMSLTLRELIISYVNLRHKSSDYYVTVRSGLVVSEHHVTDITNT